MPNQVKALVILLSTKGIRCSLSEWKEVACNSSGGIFDNCCINLHRMIIVPKVPNKISDIRNQGLKFLLILDEWSQNSGTPFGNWDFAKKNCPIFYKWIDIVSSWSCLLEYRWNLIKYDEEIMMNDDNLESNLLTSSLLKTSGLHAGTSWTKKKVFRQRFKLIMQWEDYNLVI